MIEVLVALVIVSIMLGVVVLSVGAITAADTRSAAGSFSTAVRYTYNLAAINNRVYALYINLDDNTYRAAPLDQSNDCDRLLLSINGQDTDPMVVRYGSDSEKESEDDEENTPGLFDAAMSGTSSDGEPTTDWGTDKHTPAGRLRGMMSSEVRELSNEVSRNAGNEPEPSPEDGPKRIQTFRRNQLAKAKALPKGVSFEGVLVREGSPPVTEGTVPLLFYPHGYTQRALVQLGNGQEEGGEHITVEIMTFQGSAQVHDGPIDPSKFKEETE